MLDKKFLAEQMARIEANYGRDRFKITQQVFDLWFEMFSDCEKAGFKASVEKYMKTNEFAPTVAGIRKVYEELKAYREHMKTVIMANYRKAMYWFEEKADADTYLAYANYVYMFPEKEREAKAVELANKAIGYWINCDDMGVPENERDSLKQFIERCADGH